MKKLSVFILLVIALVCITPTACKAESVVKLDCKSAILISEDGQVLQEHKSDAKRPIASMTKIMTLLLCYESLLKYVRKLMKLSALCLSIQILRQ